MKICKSTKHKRDLCKCPLSISFCLDSGPSKTVISKGFSNHFAVISSAVEWHCFLLLKYFSRRWLGVKQQKKGKVYMMVEVRWSKNELFSVLAPYVTQTKQAIAEKSFCLTYFPAYRKKTEYNKHLTEGTARMRWSLQRAPRSLADNCYRTTKCYYIRQLVFNELCYSNSYVSVFTIMLYYNNAITLLYFPHFFYLCLLSILLCLEMLLWSKHIGPNSEVCHILFISEATLQLKSIEFNVEWELCENWINNWFLVHFYSTLHYSVSWWVRYSKKLS